MKNIPTSTTTFLYLLLALLALGSTKAHAQSTQKEPVFVLVPGAWHGGWCWQQVSAQLRATGAVVYTPTLSGLGEHKNMLSKEINLSTHISDLVNLIVMEDLHNVVLVGHSYAGTVIAGVADQIPERLSKLVYLDAVIVENGQSALSVQPKETQAAMAKLSTKDNGLTVPFFSSAAFGVAPADVKWVDDRLTAQPYRCFTQPLTLHHPLGNKLPLVYIACVKPALPAMERFAAQTKASSVWKYYALNTGHDAMMTMPTELSALLASIGKNK
jgi:pimeloyl-ACP methyl ester carboxylesterase